MDGDSDVSGSHHKGFRNRVSRFKPKIFKPRTNEDSKGASSAARGNKNTPTAYITKPIDDNKRSQQQLTSSIDGTFLEHAASTGQILTPETISAPLDNNTATLNFTPNSEPTLVLNPQIISKTEQSEKAPCTKPSSLCPISELWNQAYEDLKVKEEKLMKDYESVLSIDVGTAFGLASDIFLPNSVKTTRKDQMERVLKKKVAMMKDNELRLRFNGKDIPFRDLAKPVLDIVNSANSYITNALSTNPYASIAWAGVGLILPVSSAFPGC